MRPSVCRPLSKRASNRSRNVCGGGGTFVDINKILIILWVDVKLFLSFRYVDPPTDPAEEEEVILTNCGCDARLGEEALLRRRRR